MRRRMIRSVVFAAVINAAVVPAIGAVVHMPLAFACSGQTRVAGPGSLGNGSSSTIAATRNACASGTYIQGLLNEQDPFCNWTVQDTNTVSGYMGTNSADTINGAGLQYSPGQIDTPPQMRVDGMVTRPTYTGAGYGGL